MKKDIKKEIYSPAEDSYILQETLKKFLKKISKNSKVLDMGSGSGIQALTCKKLKFKKILAADINPDAIKHLKKQKLKTVQSNLFSKIKKTQKFNLVIFNPPYLPLDKREPKSSQINTTAGKKGYEIIIKFLKQAKQHLKNKNSSILLLFSSLSKPKTILKHAKELGYNFKLLNQQKLFFEELYLFEFKQE